ncbi:MAG: PAS domain-containing protein [Pseudomonadota bacterium]
MTDDLGNNSGDVVERLRAAGPAGFEHDLKAFVNYWEGMRRGGDVPLRSTIDPRGIENLLSHAFIAEKVTPGLARLRVAGTHLSDLMGMEVRGMPLSSLIDPSHRDRLSDAMVNLFEQPARIRINLYAPGSVRRTALSGALIILPLRSDLGDISRALGCLVTHGAIGQAPRRFEITDCRITPLDLKVDDGKATSKASSQFNKPPAVQASEKRKPDAAEVQTQRHTSERPYLRLVRND